MTHIARFHGGYPQRARWGRSQVGTVVAGVFSMLVLAALAGGLVAVATWAVVRLLVGLVH
jgi:hypothetical protein